MTWSRGAIVLHAALAGAAAAAFLLLSPPRLGRAILLLVVVWNVVLPLWALAAGQRRWFDAWTLLLPLSACQLLADAVLVNALGTLHFPDLGARRLYGVPLYMALMWTIPLAWIVLAETRTRAVLLAALVFGAAEVLAAPLGLWRAGGVHTIAGAAIYVLPAELLLAAMAHHALRHGARDLPGRVASAAAVSLAYTGALLWSWLVLERGGLLARLMA